MGSEKQSGSSTTVVNQTQKATPTPEEQELLNLELERQKQAQPGMIQAQQSGLNLINQLLTGQSPLPGFFGTMAQGISPETIGTTATKMALNAMPGMQQLGLTDSGVAAKSISKNIAENLLYPAEQFNIGSLQNLLNLALSGQAQVQQPVLAGANTLSQSLAGLRSVNTSGTTQVNSAQYGMNPFLKSFQTQAGKTLGGGQMNLNFGFGG